MDTRKQAIEKRAGEVFKVGEAYLIALRSERKTVHAAMERLGEQYRKEMYGFRLVLYTKKRTKNKDSKALYWARFCNRPKAAPGPDGTRKTRFLVHLKGGLKRSDIYRNADTSRKERLLGYYDRLAALYNSAHQQLTTAMDSAKKQWQSRGDRRGGECQDPEVQPPELSPDLDPRDEAVLGDYWRFCGRLSATTVDVEIFSANYQASLIHKDLALVFVSDREHPHGRARWLYKGYPLARLGGSGMQDRLTDKWLRRMTRWLHLSPDQRQQILEVERDRRRLMHALRSYTRPLGEFLKRSAEALGTARNNLAAALCRAQDVA